MERKDTAMDFSISSELQDLLDRVRGFVETELYPLEPEFLEKGFRAVEPVLREKRRKVKSLGLWLPQIAKEYGGLGLSLVEHGLVSAELGRSPIGHYTFNCQAPDAGNMEILIDYGNEEQKERYLRPLLDGEIRSCFGMTEPDFPGSNPVWMGATAVKDGDSYVLNGRKWWTTGGDGAAFAVVMAITNPEAPPHFRASQILVPTDTPGFIIEATTPFMGHRGEGWASHSEVRLENCRVPQSNLLGAEGSGFLIAQERLGPGRIHHCMRWIGVCERSFDLMCQRAIERRITPERPLAFQQFVQGWIAESRAEIDAARWMVLHAAWIMDRHGAKEARDKISLIKFTVANTMMRVIDRAIQVHGGLGVTDYTPLALFYRTERASRIYDGADEVHKLSAAKRILKRYAQAQT
ncbi:MAG TPA: acyl-CoA dehydrogenase family protein [Candidatus Hydrogenedentes bacterium]|nr:acyl-CoA dehydrogenase family protein [Candidatus Hydrogenedentota bacterium]